MEHKSSVDEIRKRFDQDVERFSNLETGQTATVDAPLVLDLITEAAAAVTPEATAILDVGCGAGNYTLKLLKRLPNRAVTLVDLSKPMLDRAKSRITIETNGQIDLVQGDIREIEFPPEKFDIIMAAAVLHHLRDESEWQAVFTKFFRILKPGGALWISDLVTHSIEAVQQLMWLRYGEYLVDFNGESYRNLVFSYIEKEDTPRPLLFQIEMLQKAGFTKIDILHKNSTFAAFGALKPG